MDKRTELKSLPKGSTFMANGKEYVISQKLSVERWRKYEELQLMVGMGRSFDEVWKMLKRIWDALNKGKLADASVVTHNLLWGVRDKLDQRQHPALLLCTLFINRKDEDITVYSEDFMNEKIKDWTREGYDINGFFQLAWSLVPSFIEAFNEDLPPISKNTKGKKSEPLKKK